IAQMNIQDLSVIIADIVELFEPAAEEQGYKLLTNIDKDLKVRGNRELLSQLISNLIDNALKYGESKNPDNKIVEISASSNGNEIVAEVTDRGAGIPAGSGKKVLERYYRLEKSRNMPGSGLGLSLVSAIAKLHSATLDLEDNNPGLKVVLKFPKPESIKTGDG
ncbi:MAG: HAMP domain-containing histidine kinase, partial [Rhizobiaceae bacterium]|nr:HAMP domain-containing histidine kinase [Rhizobiaceae bacterium]